MPSDRALSIQAGICLYATAPIIETFSCSA
jgi:hypothetical protein